MKAIALTALSVLIALPAEATTRHQVNGSSALTCNNDGRCTTFNVTALTPGLRKTRPAITKAAVASPALDANGNSDAKKTTAIVQPPSQALDANGNRKARKSLQLLFIISRPRQASVAIRTKLKTRQPLSRSS